MSQLIELTVDECLALLARGTVGRIALRTERGLRIFPVNYALDGDDVVFRTAPYGVIANNAHGAEVAFEVDQLEEGLRTGWSVVAAGRHRADRGAGRGPPRAEPGRPRAVGRGPAQPVLPASVGRPDGPPGRHRRAALAHPRPEALTLSNRRSDSARSSAWSTIGAG